MVDVEQAMKELRAQRPLSVHASEDAAMTPLCTISVAAQEPPPTMPMQQQSVEAEERRPTEQQVRMDEEERASTQGLVRKRCWEDMSQQADEDMDPVFAALLAACRRAGYDDDISKRRHLVFILEEVLEGMDFPDDILDPVLASTGLSVRRAMQILKPQVHVVLDGMRNAVAAEESRLAELQQNQAALQAAVDEAERIRHVEAHAIKEAECQRVREKLARAGLCPMGFTWHPCGSGWRCAGGSHFVTDVSADNLL